MDSQYFLKADRFHLVSCDLKNDDGAFSTGSGFEDEASAPALASSSAASWPIIPLCPGTHTRLTEL